MKSEKVDREGIADIYNNLIDLIGFESTRKVHQTFQGQQISFPKNFYRVDYIAKEINRKYDGTNLKELAAEYHYTERHLRNLIKEYS